MHVMLWLRSMNLLGRFCVREIFLVMLLYINQILGEQKEDNWYLRCAKRKEGAFSHSPVQLGCTLMVWFWLYTNPNKS